MAFLILYTFYTNQKVKITIVRASIGAESVTSRTLRKNIIYQPTDRRDRPDHKRWAYVYIVSILVSCMHARLCHRCTKLQETKSKKQTNKYSIRILEDLLSRQQSSMLLEVAAYGKA